jgi:hypothetical protein
MSSNGQAKPIWGYAIEGKPSAMLQVALRSLQRNGPSPQPLPDCTASSCIWVRDVAECLRSGRCQAAILFCDDAALACCIANKVPGVRAAAVTTIRQACRALGKLGANLLVVEMAERTYYECRELLRLCQDGTAVACPSDVAGVLKELDGHAHR